MESVELAIALESYETDFKKRQKLVHSLREAIYTYQIEQDIQDSPIFEELEEIMGDTPITDKTIHESDDDAIALWENFESCASSGYRNSGIYLTSAQLEVMQSNPIFTKSQLKALAHLEEHCRLANNTLEV